MMSRLLSLVIMAVLLTLTVPASHPALAQQDTVEVEYKVTLYGDAPEDFVGLWVKSPELTTLGADFIQYVYCAHPSRIAVPRCEGGGKTYRAVQYLDFLQYDVPRGSRQNLTLEVGSNGNNRFLEHNVQVKADTTFHMWYDFDTGEGGFGQRPAGKGKDLPGLPATGGGGTSDEAQTFESVRLALLCAVSLWALRLAARAGGKA